MLIRLKSAILMTRLSTTYLRYAPANVKRDVVGADGLSADGEVSEEKKARTPYWRSCFIGRMISETLTSVMHAG